MPLKASQNRATAHGLLVRPKRKPHAGTSNGLRFENLRKSGGAIPPRGSTKRNDMPQQLELFGTPPKPTKQVVNTERAKAMPPYDPNVFHHIYEIKENGEREWVDSYTSKFSVKYAMEIFYCNLKHKSSFDMRNRREAQQAIKVSESMRSVTLELDGHLYICTSKPGNTAIEGKNGSKFDYEPWRPE